MEQKCDEAPWNQVIARSFVAVNQNFHGRLSPRIILSPSFSPPISTPDVMVVPENYQFTANPR